MKGDPLPVVTASQNTRTVARAPEMLTAGESYAATSKWALRVSGTADRRICKVINEDGELVLAAAAAGFTP